MLLVNEILKFVTTRDYVLDVGCGDGFITACVGTICATIVGLDRCVNKAIKPSPKLNFIECDIVNDVYRTEDADVVMLLDVLEHIPEEREEVFLKHMVCMAKKRLILNIPFQQDESQPLDRKVDHYKIIDLLSHYAELTYFKKIHIRRNEHYYFMVFSK